MRLRQLVVISFVAVCFVGAAAAQSLDEVLDKHFAAVGGKDKLAAVKSIKFSGKQQFGPNEAPFTMIWKRPNKMRVEFVFGGMTGIQAFDGKAGWSVMPFAGKTDAEPLGAEDLKTIEEQADTLEGPLFNYKEKGNQVELLGKESVEGTEAYKLKLTRKNGDISFIFIDAESMLEIKQVGKRTLRGQELEFENSTGDYKEVGGLMFPHSMESRAKGMPQGSMITFEKIELNVDVADSIFAMPPPKKAEPEPTKAPATKP